MKTKRQKLTFTIELHETENLYWVLFLQSSDLYHTLIDCEGPDSFERLRKKAESLVRTLGGATLDIQTYEQVRDGRIARTEKAIPAAESLMASPNFTEEQRESYRCDAEKWRREPVALRAWVRPATSIAA